jgi:hypothetical protein
MRAHLVGIAQASRLFAQLPLKPPQTGFPVPAVSLALPSLLREQIEEAQLVRVKILGRFGDTRPLLLEELGQRSRLLLATFFQLVANLIVRASSLHGCPMWRCIGRGQCLALSSPD